MCSATTLLCGATLWTDMGGGDPLIEQTVQRAMSDFYVIEKRDGDRLRSFRPSDARALFTASLSYIEELADTNRDKKLVVATHHAPSKLGTAPSQRDEQDQSGLLHRPYRLHRGPSQHRRVDPRAHARADRVRGRQCRVLSNARGYAGREPAAARFDPDRWFEI